MIRVIIWAILFNVCFLASIIIGSWAPLVFISIIGILTLVDIVLFLRRAKKPGFDPWSEI